MIHRRPYLQWRIQPSVKGWIGCCPRHQTKQGSEAQAAPAGNRGNRWTYGNAYAKQTVHTGFWEAPGEFLMTSVWGVCPRLRHRNVSPNTERVTVHCTLGTATGELIPNDTHIILAELKRPTGIWQADIKWHTLHQHTIHSRQLELLSLYKYTWLTLMAGSRGDKLSVFSVESYRGLRGEKSCMHTNNLNSQKKMMRTWWRQAQRLRCLAFQRVTSFTWFMIPFSAPLSLCVKTVEPEYITI